VRSDELAQICEDRIHKFLFTGSIPPHASALSLPLDRLGMLGSMVLAFIYSFFFALRAKKKLKMRIKYRCE
jgi:hypothetical protein